MAAQSKITWNGARVEAVLRAATVRGLTDAANHLLAAANALVPFDEGGLQQSGKVSVDRNALKAAVSYQKFTAVWQHEHLDWKHDPGRQAKFLETPAHTEADTIRDLIAAPIRKALRE